MDDLQPGDVMDLMGDKYAREILAHTSKRPMSVSDLQEEVDASERTIYRRLEDLQEAGLVSEDLEIDRDGHHHKRYEATLDSVLVELDDGTYEVRLRTREDAADRFARLWGEIRGENR